MPSKVHVRKSPIHGRGLFASRTITRHQLVGVFRGKPASKRSDHPHILWVEDTQPLLGTNKLRFTNHSKTPNARFEGVRLIARRKILPGEEITINYKG